MRENARDVRSPAEKLARHLSRENAVLPSEPTRLGLATGLVGMTLVLMFLSNTFAIYFLSQERFVYYWDWSMYWSAYIDISTSFVEHPIAAVRSLIELHSDGRLQSVTSVGISPV